MRNHSIKGNMRRECSRYMIVMTLLRRLPGISSGDHMLLCGVLPASSPSTSVRYTSCKLLMMADPLAKSAPVANDLIFWLGGEPVRQI